MTRLHRPRRQADTWATPHDRARSDAAERLDAPLDETEAAWLDEHLAGCEACNGTAKAYEADRLGLRALRHMAPAPPRDLWARTAAAIEHEAAGGHRATTRSARQSPIAQWGAIAGIAVVAVVVGSTFLQGGWLPTPAGSANSLDGSVVAIVTQPPQATGIAVLPAATPMVVDAGAVGWFDVGVDGSYAYNIANVNEVCAEVDRAGCAALDNGGGRRIALNSSPKSIITSPSTGQAVVVGSDESGGNQVFVVVLPARPDASPSPSPAETPAATSSPVQTPLPTPTTGPSQSPSTEPSSPAPTPSDVVLPTSSPTPSPTATASAMAIVSGVTVVGDSAAFSPDGVWFAVTARPADGSAGPDIYLWHVGDALAKAVTKDHRSVFASWAHGLVIGSRPEATAIGDAPSPDPSAPLEVAPVTFSIDPATGTEVALTFKGWRPAVAPTGDRAVAWQGSVVVSRDGSSITPANGQLSLVDWTQGNDGTFDPSSPPFGQGPMSDFTVRWDETGSWLAVWQADAIDPTVGRLSLLHLDPATGLIERPEAGPQDVPALPGFSIEDGRLAWATPPSQDGEGSRVQIVAWTADGVGTIESAPGQEVVVVR